jgi:hypothetical protein
MITRLERLKNTVNKYMWPTYDQLDLRPVSQNGSRSYVDDQVYLQGNGLVKCFPLFRATFKFKTTLTDWTLSLSSGNRPPWLRIIGTASPCLRKKKGKAIPVTGRGGP